MAVVKNKPTYDVCVVGAGLFGSAAARHLVENDPSLTVALIGPDEPKAKSKGDILGSWHDEGRITCVLDPDLTWALLSQRSINKYHDLEKKSGIKFYEPVGFLSLGITGGQLIPGLNKSAQQFKVETEALQPHKLKQKFPFLNIQPNNIGLHTEKNSGFLNPRKLVYAQQEICRQNGCDLVKEVVDEINPSSSNTWRLKLASGQVIISRKVLVTPGAFSGFRSIFPRNLLPEVIHHGTCHLLIEVKSEDLYKFVGMPSINAEGLFEGKDNRSSIIPPIKYPDGKFYMKVGAHPLSFDKLETPDQIQEWCINGSNPEYKNSLLTTAKKLFPEFTLTSYKFSHNVTTFTSTGQIYCDMIAPNFGVAIGGCAIGARCSDEIGLMAARMISKGEWDYDLPAQLFQFRAQPKSSKL